MSIKRLARRLGVSQSSVSVWVRDIQLTPEQRLHNLRRSGGSQSPQAIRRRTRTLAARYRRQRIAYQEEGRRRATRNDPLHRAGCMLFWAEGSRNRNSVRFSNSDMRMVSVFRQFLSQSLGIAPTAMCISLNVYTSNGLSVRAIEDQWLDALELPRACLRKHTLDHFPTSSSGKKRNKRPFGVCTLSVHSTRVVQHIYGAIQEYGGFDEPAWLD
jgi:hypothetical protein